MIHVEINQERLLRGIKLVPGFMREELADAFDHVAKKFLSTWRKKRLMGPPGVRGAGRTGLFGQFRYAHLIGGGFSGMGVEIFSDSSVGKRHEKGGIVKAQSGDLAVPLSARKEMFSPSGKLRKRYKKPEQLNNLVPISFLSNRKTFLCRVNKRTKEITPLYILKKQVRLKPRLQFHETWKSMQAVNMQIINKAIDKALARY
jgi:hypothetical protein